MKKKKILLNILVIHGLVINVIAAPIAFICLQPENKWVWLFVWLASLQVNAYCIYHYKRKNPDMVDPGKNDQKTPWLKDLFKMK